MTILDDPISFMNCPQCDNWMWLRIRLWYMGRRAVLWCNYCHEIVVDAPKLVEIP